MAIVCCRNIKTIFVFCAFVNKRDGSGLFLKISEGALTLAHIRMVVLCILGNCIYTTLLINFSNFFAGELHVPLEVCGAVVKRELDYWQVNQYAIKSCCWRHYRSYIENKWILDSFNRSIQKEQISMNLDHLHGWKRFQMRMWFILEHPRTSRIAMVILSNSL